MNIYLTIAITFVNVIAITIVYQFIKRLPQKEKIIFLASSIAIMYILVLITYWISGFGIDANVHDKMKNFIVYLFVPINVILIIPYFANKYIKLRKKEISRDEFAKIITKLGILLLIVLVIEFIYFKKTQTDKSIANSTNIQNVQTTESTNSIN